MSDDVLKEIQALRETLKFLQDRIDQIEWLFLMAVAAGAVWHSLKYRSENITALALLLGFITTSISNVTYFTLASSVLLVGALAWIVMRMRWHGLYLYGVIASYATYLFWIDPQIRLSQKILFVDLAGAETIYRILSFIVAGVILLLASFAYARFAGKLTPSKKL